MLRNSYLEPYQIQRKNISEFEKEMLAHDENHLLNLERPLSTGGIGKLSNTILPSFIDDIMCNKNINTLLYSSNAKKELTFYLKQKKSLLRNQVYIKKNPFFLSSSRRPCETVFLRKKKAAMYQTIKENISAYKCNKRRSMKLLKKKNHNFQKEQINTNKLFTQLYFKPVNDIRIEGYKKAVEDCLNKSEKYLDFSLPNISFNINDVYSRLYHNVIFNPIKIKTDERKTVSNEHKNKYLNINTISNIGGTDESKISENNKSLFYKKINKQKMHKNKTVNNFNSYYTNRKNLPIFNLKKILKGSDGKEFFIKRTESTYRQCWSKNSGGPKIKKKYNRKIIKKLLETENSNSKYGNGIVDVNSYRDKDKNSNLNIAIKRNNAKFVQYFLDKKYNPNEKNKYGDTALHLSMKNKNKPIIRLLLNKGADITIKNKKGITPYDLATKEIKKEFKLDNIMILKKTKKKVYH